MSGASIAPILGAPSTILRVTLGTNAGVVGYVGGGTVTPSKAFGLDVQGASSDTSTHDFRFAITRASGGTASFFRRLIVEDGTGARRQYDTASATYANVGGGSVAQWQWGNGSNPVWQSGDVGETHTVELYF